MSNPYTVSDYLLARLKELGIGHVFGVPGDYAFPFIDRLVDDPDLTWVGGCNEHNAGLSADGYARVHGIAAMTYTAGPGELGAASAMGGSYDDQVPVISIVGHPPLHAGSYVMTHHGLAGDFSRYARIFAELSVGHAELGEENPCEQIDEVLKAVWRERRPGWIAMPKDVQTMPAQPPVGPLDLPDATSDPAQLNAFMTELLARLDAARTPAILVDFPVGRYRLTASVEELADKSGIPLAIAFGARAAFFDESAPGFLGAYYAPVPGEPVSDRISGADLLLRLAPQSGETNHSCADPAWHPDHVVDVQILGARIGDTEYPGVALADVITRLLDTVSHRDIPVLPAGHDAAGVAPSFVPRADTALTENRVLDGIAALLREGDVLVSDQGTCYAATALPKPARVKTIAQSAWGAIGYATPALLGAMIADPGPRHIHVSGDGGFQEVAQELSTILHHDLAPIMIVFHNSRYLVENLIGGTELADAPYNVIPSWDYHELPRVLGPDSGAVGLRVTNEEEWARAIATAETAQAEGKLVLIEAILPVDDVSDSYRHLTSPTTGTR